jgi:hypothetical protein
MHRTNDMGHSDEVTCVCAMNIGGQGMLERTDPGLKGSSYSVPVNCYQFGIHTMVIFSPKKFFYAMFGIEPIVSCVLGKHYVTELYSQSLNF